MLKRLILAFDLGLIVGAGIVALAMILATTPHRHRHRSQAERHCWVCGCTNARPCPSGCEWIAADLCSKCVQAAVEQPYKRRQGNHATSWER
jgi:hypothetical protein